MQVGMHEFLHLLARRTPPTRIVDLFGLTVDVLRQPQGQGQVSTTRRAVEQQGVGQVIGLYGPRQKFFCVGLANYVEKLHGICRRRAKRLCKATQPRCWVGTLIVRL